MNILKFIIKLILGVAIGITAGLAIAAICIVCFTDISFSEYMLKLRSIEFRETCMAAGTGILAFIVSLLIIIPVHELGHLVCGLLSGYKFVSFRIFNLTFINIDGKIRVKHYSVAGTGGQCLLSPPDLPLDKIPTTLYNFGGVLANIILGLIVLPLLWLDAHPFVHEAVVIFLLTDAFLILINGVPMKVSGAGNDGYNIMKLGKNLTSKRSLIVMLKSNEAIQNGVRPKDMPAEWFEVPKDVDYRNQLEISLPIMAASRHLDEMDYQKALQEFEHLYANRNRIIPLYTKEIACELVFLRLICGHTKAAEELLDFRLRSYLNTYRKVMSSKERIMCAIALFLENDRPKATSIYHNLLKRESQYLLQGEVKSDLALMKAMLE